MSSKILKELQTIDDLSFLEEEVNMVKDGAYTAKGEGISQTLANKVRNSMSKLLLEEICDVNDHNNVVLILDKIIQEAKSLSVVQLKLGFEPTTSQITHFSKSACELAGKQILLDIFFDPQIVGGAEIVSNGKFYDGTINKTFTTSLDQYTKTVPREGDFLIGRYK